MESQLRAHPCESRGRKASGLSFRKGPRQRGRQTGSRCCACLLASACRRAWLTPSSSGEVCSPSSAGRGLASPRPPGVLSRSTLQERTRHALSPRLSSPPLGRLPAGLASPRRPAAAGRAGRWRRATGRRAARRARLAASHKQNGKFELYFALVRPKS